MCLINCGKIKLKEQTALFLLAKRLSALSFLTYRILLKIQHFSFCADSGIHFSVYFQIFSVFHVQCVSLGFYTYVFQRYTFRLADDNAFFGIVDDYILYGYILMGISGSPLKNMARPEPLQIILEIWMSRKDGVSTVTWGTVVFMRPFRSSSVSSPAALPP